MASFQCVLGSLYNNFYIVEPYIPNSHVIGAGKGAGDPKFSTFFDFDAFNLESRRLGYPEMVTMEEFEKSSPYYVIYIAVHARRNTQKILWKTNRDAEEWNCYEGVDADSSRAQLDTSKLKSEYCIVRVIQLPVLRIATATDEQDIADKVTSSMMTRSSMYDFIFGEFSPQEVTVIFGTWSNKLYLPVEAPLHGIDCANISEAKNQFKTSEKLSQDAKKYEDKFLGGQNRLAVMLRVERTVKSYLQEVKGLANSSLPKSLEECFQKVLSVSSAVDATPIVTLDIGKFGSGTYSTLDKSAKILSKSVLMALYKNQWSVQEWEESFIQVTDGVTDRSYVAALQKTLASRADCLVLMGGGSFQAFAVQEYLDYHRNSKEHCIELVCGMTRNDEVQKTINLN